MLTFAQIPGITAPLSHLPTLILAFLLAQLVHELGHALAGALEDIAPSKLAFSLHAVLPSASIVFPSNVEFYPVRARARIATSGPWHNLLMWLTLISLVPFGHGIFYTNRAHDGRIVVNPGDRFTNHLRRGDLITHVDDFFIGGRDDVWTQYLSGTDTDDEEKGWCLSKWEFGDARLAPCTSDTMVGFQEVGAVGDGALARCLEPHSIIAQPITNCRCPVSQVCIRPAASEHLVRVRYKRGGEKTDTLLWAGDRSALLEVEVSMRSPRIWSSGTRWFEIFMSCVHPFLFYANPQVPQDGHSLSVPHQPPHPAAHRRHSALQRTAVCTPPARRARWEQ